MHIGSPRKGCGLPLQDCSLSESRLGFTEGCGLSDRDNPPDPHIANPKSETPQQVQQGKHMEINSASLVIRKMHMELHVTPTPTRTVTFSGWSVPRAGEDVEEWDTHTLLWEWTSLRTLCSSALHCGSQLSVPKSPQSHSCHLGPRHTNGMRQDADVLLEAVQSHSWHHLPE